MGNEDVVVSKNKKKDKKIIDLNDVENVKDKLENMTLECKYVGKKAVEKEPIDFVHVLPLEVIEEIFVYLEPKDLASCTSVSTAWREAVNSNKVWGHLCDSKGWKDDFDPNFSHFYRAHKQFRRWAHSYDSFSPICQKRLLYNKRVCLQNNWRWGVHVIHKISNGSQNYLQLFEPVTCDGKYLVMLERSSKYSQTVSVGVWSLDGIPFRVCDLPLPSPVQNVDAIAFSHETVVIAQAWTVIAYHLKNDIFKRSFEKTDLKMLEPKKLPREMKKMVPFMKITEEHIICVPNQSHSTNDFIPIFFWDRLTGELKHRLCFDSMYYFITVATWFKDSCYLGLTNKKKKSYQIVEFNTKSAEWESFSQSITVEVEQIEVSNLYVLAVTRTTNPSFLPLFSRDRNDNLYKELWLWDRATGSALKTFDAQGKNFQFVGDGENLMYFATSKVTVMNPKAPNMCSEFEVTGTISSIRASSHSSILVIIKTGCYIEVWDWGLGSRLYTVTAETGYGSQLWCDDKRIITYHSSESTSGGGIMVLGFW